MPDEVLPLVDALNRIIGPNDLFGVMTPIWNCAPDRVWPAARQHRGAAHAPLGLGRTEIASPMIQEPGRVRRCLLLLGVQAIRRPM